MTARERLPINLFMFFAFIAAYRPLTTGLSLHEWLSLVLVAPILVHLVINWDWAVRVSVSFSRQLRKMNRVNLVVDVVLFVATVTTMLSGFMVSRVVSGFLGFAAPAGLVWHTVHSASADVVIALALLHTALHWKWFARVLGVRPGRSAGSAGRGLSSAGHLQSAGQRGFGFAEPATVVAQESWWSEVPVRVRDDYHRSQGGAPSAGSNRGSR
jgi:hypothetical protein